MTDWDARSRAQNTAEAITRRATAAISGASAIWNSMLCSRPSCAVWVRPPALPPKCRTPAAWIRSLRQDARPDLADARRQAQLSNVRLTNLPDQPTLQNHHRYGQIGGAGVAAANVNTTLAAWGGPMSTTLSTATV
jgi:multidrug efflux pump